MLGCSLAGGWAGSLPPKLPPSTSASWPGPKQAGLRAFVFCREPTAAQAGRTLARAVHRTVSPAGGQGVDLAGGKVVGSRAGRRTRDCPPPSASQAGALSGTGTEAWEGSREAAGSPEAPRLPARPEALQAKSGSSLWEQQTTAGRLLWPCRRAGKPSSFLHIGLSPPWTPTTAPE